MLFQSTPPVREVTSMERGIPPEQRISIHTSRAGGDDTVMDLQADYTNFNPHLPCGR